MNPNTEKLKKELIEEYLEKDLKPRLDPIAQPGFARGYGFYEIQRVGLESFVNYLIKKGHLITNKK